jgi:hypothetical protein
MAAPPVIAILFSLPSAKNPARCATKANVPPSGEIVATLRTERWGAPACVSATQAGPHCRTRPRRQALDADVRGVEGDVLPRALVGVELVGVPQLTKGPPHLLYDLHLFE